MKPRTIFPILLMAVFCLGAGCLGASQDGMTETVQEEIVVPEGTVIPIILTAYLNTRNSQVGDIAYAETNFPIWIQQRLVIPRGSSVRGTVTEVVRAGRLKGKGSLAIRFDDILLPNGVQRPLIAAFRGIHGPGSESLDRQAETVTAGEGEGSDAGTVVGMGSQGAIIGAIAGRGEGAIIGAGAGAAAGVATVLFSRGPELVLSPGTQFDIELKRPLRFAFNEIEFSSADLNRARRVTQPRPANSNPGRPAVGRGRNWPFPRFGFPFSIYRR